MFCLTTAHISPDQSHRATRPACACSGNRSLVLFAVSGASYLGKVLPAVLPVATLLARRGSEDSS